MYVPFSSARVDLFKDNSVANKMAKNILGQLVVDKLYRVNVIFPI